MDDGVDFGINSDYISLTGNSNICDSIGLVFGENIWRICGIYVDVSDRNIIDMHQVWLSRL